MNSFYDNLAYMTTVFDRWTPCERTVVLCALFRQVPWYNLKLLKTTLESSLERCANSETETIEKHANDVGVITETAKTTDENDQPIDVALIGQKLMKLLIYLPLLEQSNERVKDAYLNSVPDIIQLCVDNNCYMHECKQYLSYMLIHPALDTNDRGSLGHWLRYLENHLEVVANMEYQVPGSTSPSNYGSADSINNGYASGNNVNNGYASSNGSLNGAAGSNGNLSNGTYNSNGNLSEGTNGSTGNLSVNGNVANLAALPSNSSNGAFRRTIGKNIEPKNEVNAPVECLQESFTKNGKELDLSDEVDNVEPLSSKSQRSNSLTPPMPSYISSSAENLNTDEYFVQKPRSFSLSSEHMAQLKPLLTTTGSETRLDELRANKFGEHPGMSTVAQWLKSLRLHKYVWLFSNISYEQMMAMDEEYLTKLGVTTGARTKLLICINKLHSRSSLLDSMSQELRAGAAAAPTIAHMLDQLRSVLVSPMPPGSRLCGQLVQVLELASTRLLNSAQVHPPLPAFPAYNHHAEDQSYDHPAAGYDPLSMHCWLLDRALHHPSFTCDPELVDKLKKLRYRLPPRQFFSHLSDVPFTKRSVKPRWVRGPTSKPQVSTTKRPSGSFLPIPNKYGAPPPVPPPRHGSNKSSSYPSFPATSQGHKSADSSPRLNHNVSVSFGDINTRLESLCLQMTEQAMTE